MIGFICDLLIFLYIWFTTNLFHEMMHCFAVYIQNGKGYKIITDFDKLSMHMTYNRYSVKSNKLVSYAGGLFTSPFMFMMGLLTTGSLRLIFVTMAMIQLTYGIFEGKYIHEISKSNYLYGRYIIYAFYIFIMLIIYIFI